jgi:hypothetical protein
MFTPVGSKSTKCSSFMKVFDTLRLYQVQLQKRESIAGYAYDGVNTGIKMLNVNGNPYRDKDPQIYEAGHYSKHSLHISLRTKETYWMHSDIDAQ